MKTFSVCYILSYYIPDYVRTRTLISALEKIDNIKIYQARNSSKGFLRYFQTISQLITIRILHNPDFYILGFRGYEFFWVVRLITIGKTLILDHMMSPYDSLMNEHKSVKKGGWIAKLIYLYEKSIILSSKIILTDTIVHKEFFQKLFNIHPEKILAIPVGTDEDLFHTTTRLEAPTTSSDFGVLFYGSFLPLHGMDIILKAAALLQDYPIHFTLVGGYKTNLSNFHQMMKDLNLKNVKHINWVPFEQLPQLISQADIGLGGPFGNTGQAHRVVTGKTFQFLAMAKPVIIGETIVEYGFKDKGNCLVVPQGDEKALADAIYWAFQNQSELIKIGQQGYDLYHSNYSIARISEKLKGVFSS